MTAKKTETTEAALAKLLVALLDVQDEALNPEIEGYQHNLSEVEGGVGESDDGYADGEGYVHLQNWEVTPAGLSIELSNGAKFEVAIKRVAKA